MRALVIGGGIAGPVAALALARAGVQTALCEAAVEPAESSDPHLTLPSNAIDALAAIGLDGAVERLGFAVSRSLFVDRRGRPLGALPLAAPRADARPSRVLRRSALRALLLDTAARHGVQIELGKRLTGAEPDAAGVVARFDDETVAGADLLVGADGLWSTLRRYVDPRAPAPRDLGVLTFRGVTPDVAAAPEPGAWTLVVGRRALFGYVTDAAGSTVWFVQAPARELVGRKGEAVGPGEWPRRILDLFSEREGPARELLASGMLDTVAEPAFELAPLARWHRGAIVLVGDAAHAVAPSTGQGAAMAIEDAVEMAQAVRDLPDPETAFSAYRAARIARVRRVVAEGRRGTLRRMPGPLGRRLRDAVLRLGFRFLIGPRSYAWLYDRPIDWAARVAAPPVRRRRG
jgi:FAD-dependent urate hydroxylase